MMQKMEQNKKCVPRPAFNGFCEESQRRNTIENQKNQEFVTHSGIPEQPEIPCARDHRFHWTKTHTKNLKIQVGTCTSKIVLPLQESRGPFEAQGFPLDV